MDWPRGCVQVYTGNGKGKTTAALGVALRAAGAGIPVFIAQFIKGVLCSEHRALERFDDLITIRQYGRGCFLRGTPAPEDVSAAVSGLAEAKSAMVSGDYRVVILDEANVAVAQGLFSVAELLAVIAARPAHVELIITGRNANEQILVVADLVTEMREVKHYQAAGIAARVGIEK